MSQQRIRHFVLAVTVGLIALLPASPANANSTQAQSGLTLGPPRSADAIATIRDTGPPIMQQAADYVAAAPMSGSTVRSAPQSAGPLNMTNPRLYREVFGFAYAQSIGDPTIGYPSWNMSLLSTVAYFGVHVDWTGALVSDSGLTIWNDPNGPVPGLISTAHASGTKVVLTIIMGDSTSDQRNICSALDRWQTTVQQTVGEVQSLGADGVNVDYEGSNVTCMDPGYPQVSSQSLFTSFVSRLRSALPAGSYLSVDTYTGSAGYRDSMGHYLGFFDIGGLANYVDSFMVMAYDMEYDNAFNPPLNCSTYCLGPTSPITTYYWNDSRAASEYSAVVSPSKVIMGIPYYGRKECVSGYTPSNAPPNAPRAAGTGWSALGYLDATGENGFTGNTDYHTHRDAVDSQGSTEWDTWTSAADGCTREMYYDDVTSLGNKYNLVINDHLRGIGIFTLSYGGGAPELWSLLNLKFGQCSEGAITADHVSPQLSGTSVTFTGLALCAGTGTYRFWMQAPGSPVTMVQDYSTTQTWTWKTSGLPLGTYTFVVDSRNQGSSVAYDTRSTMTFRLAPCAAPVVTPAPASPQLPATSVVFTASAACTGTPEYQFWILAPGAPSWTVVQPYSSASSFTWDTTKLLAGNYLYTVWVRNAGTTGTSCGGYGCSDSYLPATSYVLTNQPCTLVTDTPASASPQPSGTTVTFTAGATGCPHPLYQFWILGPGSGSTWQVAKPFSTASTLDWNTTGLPAGTYLYTVWAKDAASTGMACNGFGCFDTYSPATAYSLIIQPCASVTMSAAQASPQLSGTPVTFNASAAGCPRPLYQFWVLAPGSTWRIAQAYSSSASFTWATAGLGPGSYLYTVWVRDVSSAGQSCNSLGCFDAYAPAASFTLTRQPCTSVSESVTPASPQASGTTVTFSATASGCPSALYQFWVLAPGRTWQVLQPYAAGASVTWDTSGLAAGTYLYTVWVRDTSSGGVSCGSLGCSDAYARLGSFVLTSQPCTSVMESVAPASPQAHGTTVTFTATASGCAHPLYEFWILAPGSHTWQIVQAYSSTATFTWSTGNLSAGAYTYTVWVRDASSSGTMCNSLGCQDAYATATTYSLT